MLPRPTGGMTDIDPGTGLAPVRPPAEVLPPTWDAIPPVLELPDAPTIAEIRALVERGSPGDPLVRNAYVGTLLEVLPGLRAIALSKKESTKNRAAAGKLMQQIVQTLGGGLGGKGSAAAPVTSGRGRRLSFSVVVESFGETSVRDALEEVAQVVQDQRATGGLTE